MSFKSWPAILAVLLVLVAIVNMDYLAPYVPGYSALREAYPFYVALSYYSVFEILLVLVTAFALLRKLDQRVFATLGLARAPWGDLKAVLIMVLPLYLVFALAFDIARMVPMAVLYLAAISPFAEELAFRGFAFGLLRKFAGWGFWPAALLPAAFFAWGHIGQANDLSSVIMTLAITGIGAILFAWLFEKWGGLWVPLGLHITMNFAWELFAVGEGAFAGTLPTVMQLTTVVVAILVTLFRERIPILRQA